MMWETNSYFQLRLLWRYKLEFMHPLKVEFVSSLQITEGL